MTATSLVNVVEFSILRAHLISQIKKGTKMTATSAV